MSTDKERGYYNKYIILRTDGQPLKENGGYFVMRFGGDDAWARACRKAGRTLAEAIKNEYPALSTDLQTLCADDSPDLPAVNDPAPPAVDLAPEPLGAKEGTSSVSVPPVEPSPKDASKKPLLPPDQHEWKPLSNEEAEAMAAKMIGQVKAPRGSALHAQMQVMKTALVGQLLASNAQGGVRYLLRRFKEYTEGAI